MRGVLLSIKGEITLRIVTHHSSTLTQFITSSSYEKKAILSLKMMKCAHVQHAKHSEIIHYHLHEKLLHIK